MLNGTILHWQDEKLDNWMSFFHHYIIWVHSTVIHAQASSSGLISPFPLSYITIILIVSDSSSGYNINFLKSQPLAHGLQQ